MLIGYLYAFGKIPAQNLCLFLNRLVCFSLLDLECKSFIRCVILPHFPQLSLTSLVVLSSVYLVFQQIWLLFPLYIFFTSGIPHSPDFFPCTFQFHLLGCLPACLPFFFPSFFLSLLPSYLPSFLSLEFMYQIWVSSQFKGMEGLKNIAMASVKGLLAAS